MKNTLEKLSQPSMKTLFEARFDTAYRQNKLYGKRARLLAVQLNGFSHKVFFDYGSAGTEVVCQNYSGCMPENPGPASAQYLFKDVAHQCYQGQPKEIIYILPKDR